MKITKKEKKELIKASSIFQDWPNSLLFQIYPLFLQVDYPRKTQIYQQDSLNEYLYIIVSGEVELAKQVTKVTKPLIILSKGQCFGDYEVKKELTHRLTNATATLDCTLLYCPVKLFIEILSQNQSLFRAFMSTQKILIDMQLASLNPVEFMEDNPRKFLQIPHLKLNLNKPSDKLLKMFKQTQDAFFSNQSSTKRSLNTKRTLQNVNSPHQQIVVQQRTSRINSLFQSIVAKPMEQDQMQTLTHRKSLIPQIQSVKQIVDFIPHLRTRRSQTWLRANA